MNERCFSLLCRCLMFQDAFSIAEPPIWMDSTNTKQVRQLEDAVGGPEVLQTFVNSTKQIDNSNEECSF